MAYINEFGETVAASCPISFSDKLVSFFYNWHITLLPLTASIVIFFILKRYLKKNKVLILTLYTIIVAILVILLYILWWINVNSIKCD